MKIKFERKNISEGGGRLGLRQKRPEAKEEIRIREEKRLK